MILKVHKKIDQQVCYWKQAVLVYRRVYNLLYKTVKRQMEYKKRLFEDSHCSSKHQEQENSFHEGNGWACSW